MNEEMREKDKLKKKKKIILLVIGSLITFAILYFLIGLIDFDALFNKPDDNTTEQVKIHFYDESYSKFPSEDEWYMTEAFKNITYVYGTGTTFSDEIQNEKDALAKSESLLLLYNFIEYIKAGNTDHYNNCFSEYYYGTHQRQTEFTKQKIYDIIITELPSETKSDNGISFIEYNFTVEYRIRHNNGSLRKDIGSDQSRKQYFEISNRSGQGLKIDNIVTIIDTIIK